MARPNSRIPPAAYLAYRGTAGLVRRLPTWSLPALERFGSRVAVIAMPDRRRQVERNLARVYGSEMAPPVQAEAVRETFAGYIRYWVESFRLPGTLPSIIDDGVHVDGFGHIEAALSEGNGVILALPHLGGWEWAAYWLTSVKGVKVSAVVEALQPPELAEWFVTLRESFGIELIPLGPKAGSQSAKALRNNHLLCLLCDRDLQGSGIEVEFFGEKTTLPGGPATLALRGGTPLITAATYFNGPTHHRFVVDPPIDTVRSGSFRSDVERVTGEVAERLEVLIRAAPEQWHLLQPNWPSDES